MRIAVLADIHGNVLALEAVLGDLPKRGADRVVNLGDCVSGPLWPAETADVLMRLNWPTVRGNHDRWVAAEPPGVLSASDAYALATLRPEHLAWLRGLPATLSLAPEVFACHGRPHDDNAYLLENVKAGHLVPADPAEVSERIAAVGARVVLCAHSHLASAVGIGDRTVVNPGSVGQPAYHDPTPPEHASEAGSPDARYAVVELRPDGRVGVEHVSVAYDHVAAARRAEDNRSPAWVRFLTTGYAR